MLTRMFNDVYIWFFLLIPMLVGFAAALVVIFRGAESDGHCVSTQDGFGTSILALIEIMLGRWASWRAWLHGAESAAEQPLDPSPSLCSAMHHSLPVCVGVALPPQPPGIRLCGCDTTSPPLPVPAFAQPSSLLPCLRHTQRQPVGLHARIRVPYLRPAHSNPLPGGGCGLNDEYVNRKCVLSC
jgi:hypothetical protein